MSNQTVDSINSARARFNATHPEKARSLLVPATHYHQVQIATYAYVADSVAQKFSCKGLPYEDLHSACLEAVVRCVIKMDTRPYQYTLVYKYCSDACLDALRAFYRRRNLQLEEDCVDGIVEVDEQDAELLGGVLADAPPAYRKMIIDHLLMEPDAVRVKYAWTPKAYSKVMRRMKKWMRGYLYSP